MRDENILYWIWLAECFGIAPKDFSAFIGNFESPYEVYTMNDEEIGQIEGISAKRAERLCDKSLEGAYNILKYCRSKEIDVIPYTSAEYPEKLRTIEDPPVILYCKGRLPRLDNRLCIGMVGTRSMSEYGKQTSYKISYELAASGACIISGMALGVDGVCACGAIEGGGQTVAVLGCGVEVVYPSEHRRLMKIIEKNGAVISEYSPTTPPDGYHFPQRNRIISGMSHGVVVVEAAKRSGALITADRAVKQGRMLFAVPGKVGDAQSAGPNDLIRKGANIVLCAEDVLASYEFLYGHMINRNRLNMAQRKSDLDEKTLKKYGVSSRAQRIRQAAVEQQTTTPEVALPQKQAPSRVKRACEGLDELTRKIYDSLPEDGSITLDKIADTGISVKDVASSLTMLEILGLVTQLPGGAYKKT